MNNPQDTDTATEELKTGPPESADSDLFDEVSTAEQKGARWRRKIGPLGVCGLSP